VRLADVVVLLDALHDVAKRATAPTAIQLRDRVRSRNRVLPVLTRDRADERAATGP
jgi:hypothetical protein